VKMIRKAAIGERPIRDNIPRKEGEKKATKEVCSLSKSARRRDWPGMQRRKKTKSRERIEESDPDDTQIASVCGEEEPILTEKVGKILARKNA